MNTLEDAAAGASAEAHADAASEVVLASDVLSRSGIYEASIEERKLVCLLADGRLLVAQGQRLNPHVQSYCARLQRMRRPFNIIDAPVETIHRTYGTDPGNAGARHQEHSMMQITAKDLLNKACENRASDIHIRVRKTSTEFFFRIHNELVHVGGQTREYGERLLATLYGAMTAVSDNSYKPTERQDASIGDRDKLPNILYGVRIATAPTSEGSLMVLRLLYNDAGEKADLRSLGLSAAHAATIQLLKEQPIGMNIISGPTGSGKSTTLQRILVGEVLESKGKLDILTVEDPVEYPIEGAVQTAVTNAGTEEERSRMFSAAIANAMRLDPDTIMIGEIRDGASAQSALRAAMTGHQVWTTVHANGALAIIDRLVDLGVPLSLATDHTIITGLISQRLVKILCPHCKKRLVEHRREVPANVLGRLQKAIGAHIENVCIAGDGCAKCNRQATIGRSAVAEVIATDAKLFDYLRAGEKQMASEYWVYELGGKTLLEHAIEAVASGTVDPRAAEKIVGHLNFSSRLGAEWPAGPEVLRAV